MADRQSFILQGRQEHQTISLEEYRQKRRLRGA